VSAQVEVLLPCPFCNSSDLIFFDPFEGDSETERVLCRGCNAEGPFYGGTDSTDQREGAMLWNRRAGVPS
jgi:Lar family restriction alleviation protein